MARKIGWFSAGAASAVACAIAEPDIVAYCDTGSEDEDNARFLADCETEFGWTVTVLKSDAYNDTWDVWEKTKFLASRFGARCTGELKVAPRIAFQKPDDVHVFGYTYDARDRARSEKLKENFFELNVEFPLIHYGITKSACMSILQDRGLQLPRVYEMGFHNANCIPCPKATSPAYYALVRKVKPDLFWRLAKLSRKLNTRLCRINGERRFIDEIPEDHPTTNPIVPNCDLLCAIARDDLTETAS